MACRGGTSAGGQWVEMVVVDADKRVGESLSTVPSTRKRMEPAPMHQQTLFGPHAPHHSTVWRRTFSGSRCGLSTERLRALCAAARSLSSVPLVGGSAAQAAGLGEPSGTPPKLELGPYSSHRPYPDARLCAGMRAQVLLRSPCDEPTTPGRRPTTLRWPPPPSPPSATSSPPAATARARCAPRAENRTGACVDASQLP